MHCGIWARTSSGSRASSSRRCFASASCALSDLQLFYHVSRLAYKAAVVAEAHGPSYESRKHQFQKRRPPPSTPTFVLERRLQTLLQVPAPKTRPLPHSAPTTPRSPRWRSPPSKPVRGTARQLVTSPRVRRLTNNPYDINAAGFSQYLETMPEPREGGLWIGTGNPS